VAGEPYTISPAHPQYAVGVAASLVAEVVFILMVAGVTFLRGKDPWMVVKVPESFLLGPAAVHPGGFVLGDILLGLFMHLLLGILVGLLYAALLPQLGLSPLAGGLLTAVLLYGLGFWILPLIFSQWLAPFWLPPLGKVLQLIAHAVYGVVLGAAFRKLVYAHDRHDASNLK
jgi:hypothetical protein